MKTYLVLLQFKRSSIESECDILKEYLYSAWFSQGGKEKIGRNG